MGTVATSWCKAYQSVIHCGVLTPQSRCRDLCTGHPQRDMPRWLGSEVLWHKRSCRPGETDHVSSLLWCCQPWPWSTYVACVTPLHPMHKMAGYPSTCTRTITCTKAWKPIPPISHDLEGGQAVRRSTSLRMLHLSCRINSKKISRSDKMPRNTSFG